MRIENIYTPELHRCRVDDTLTIATQQMRDAEIGALAVVDREGVLVGIISERDVARAVADGANPNTTTVLAYATTDVAISTVTDDSVDVATRMLDAGIRHMPVAADGRLIGMVSMRNLLAVQAWV